MPLQLAGAGVELEVLKGKDVRLFPSNTTGRMPGQVKCPAKECVTILCQHTINGICFPVEKGWETKLKEARNGSINRKKRKKWILSNK